MVCFYILIKNLIFYFCVIFFIFQTFVKTILHDIKFPFDSETDTCDSLAKELVNAALISPKDHRRVSEAMDKSIKTGKDCFFETTIDGKRKRNKETMIGYGRISIRDINLEEKF